MIEIIKLCKKNRFLKHGNKVMSVLVMKLDNFGKKSIFED
jgi:hypothetical protein